MSIILNILNGNNLDENFHSKLYFGKVLQFKYAKITSCDVDHSFNKNKTIIFSYRRLFYYENVEHHSIVSCNVLE